MLATLYVKQEKIMPRHGNACTIFSAIRTYITVSFVTHQIFNLPVMAAENFDGIKKIQTVGKRSLESLESVNLHEKFDPFLVVVGVIGIKTSWFYSQGMGPFSRRSCGNIRASDKQWWSCKWSNAINPAMDGIRHIFDRWTWHVYSRWTAPTANAPIDMQCVLCEWIHLPFRCDAFRELSLSQRWDFVDKQGLCNQSWFSLGSF